MADVAVAAGPYYVNCGGQHVSRRITSVMGEIRTETSTTTVPYRYHAGVDVADYCTDGVDVFAIEAGAVSTPITPGCSTSFCRRVTSANRQHAFEYVDILSTLADGATVQVGDLIGRISNVAEGPHLHLNEIQGIGAVNCSDFNNDCYRVNPQRENALIFVDTDVPVFTTFTVGAVTDQEIILVKYAGTGPKGGQTPVPFVFLDDTFFVNGQVDVLTAVHNVGTEPRKGVYLVDMAPITAGQSCNALNINPRPNIVFNSLFDQPTIRTDILTTYFKQFTYSNGFIATDWQTNYNRNQQTQPSNWITSTYPEGPRQICVSATSYPRGQTRSLGVNVVIDRTPPATPTLTDINGTPFTVATSSTAIIVEGNDSGSGVYTISLTGPNGFFQVSTNTVVSSFYSIGFSTDGNPLANGSYSAQVCDLAQNCTSNGFNISSNQAGSSMNNAGGQSLPSTHSSNYCEVMTSSESISGIQSMTRQGAMTSATATFDCVPVAGYGPFCAQSAGNYTWTMQTCAGVTSSTTTTVQSAAATFSITEDASSAETTITETQALTPGAVLRLDVCGPPMGNCNGCTADRYAEISLPGAGPFCGSPGGGGGSSCCMGIVLSDVVSTAYTVTNTTQTSPNFELTASARVVKTGEGAFTVVVTTVAPYTGNTSGNITIAEFGQPSCVSTPGADRQVCAPASGVTTSTAPCTGLISMLIHSLFPPITCTEVHGSEIVYTSSASIAMSFSSGAGGVATDTTTLAIFQFTGTQWSSATVTDQTISSNSGTITLTGNFARTGLFGAFFVATDTTPPVTSFVIQGSSYSFDGTIFVSTDAYAVLTATDPVVNGFASTVATITYRLDPSSGTAYSVYASSIPLPLGTHVFEYRSHDYAGNVEAVKTATFTVTAGTAFRNSGSLQVAGSLLNGFLGSGARLEIESQAQNNLTLLVSSVNRQGMVAVDNIGEVGIGVTPQANLDIGAAPIALQLRSGNSTSSVTSAQIAFAYNGDGSYRHFLRTEHSTSTDGNKLDFLVWNPSAGSTTTLASLNVLSLQGIASASGGSFHVNPAGEPDAEVEVSNGAATGGGTIQYGELVAPSSRRFKTDIKDLSEADEARALADVAALKHVRFRYKALQKGGRLTDDPNQPLHTGLIYEEAPESLRGVDGTLSTVERLANVEMALKAAMTKLEKLQKRYAELKKRSAP